MNETQIFQNILEFVFCVVDSYLLYMFGTILFKPKLNFRNNFIWILITSVALFGIGYFEAYTTLVGVLQFGLLIAYVQLFFVGSKKAKFVLSLLYYITLGIVTMIVSSMLAFLQGDIIGTFSNNFILRIITLVLIKAVMLGILVILSRKIKGFETSRISTKHFMAYLLIVLLVLILTFEVLFLQNEAISSVLIVMIFAIFVVIFAVSLILLFRYYSNREKIATMELMIKEANIRRDLDIQSLKPQVEVMKLKHDLKNHFLTLRTLLEQEEVGDAQEYINRLVSHPAMKSYVHTNNEVINAVLNAKISEHLDIAFKVRHDEGNYHISSEILTVILGNAMDNAIEAVDKLDGNKEVTIILSENAQYCKIFIANDMAEKPQIHNQQLLSSKRENSVGFGIMNMQEAVDKQGGKLEYRLLENRFELIILLEK